MIFGIGIDLIEVERVADKVANREGFRELVFSPNEISYCESKTHKYQHYAARFAAKEAFFKALGTGWKSGSAFNEVEIVNNSDGQPKIFLLGKTAISLETLQLGKISVSLSHLGTMASAVVIIEK